MGQGQRGVVHALVVGSGRMVGWGEQREKERKREREKEEKRERGKERKRWWDMTVMSSYSV